jgi:hypothetical protein
MDRAREERKMDRAREERKMDRAREAQGPRTRGARNRPADKVAAMKLDRRWLFAIVVAVIAVAALVLSRFGVFGPSAEDCRPVKDLLAFNRSQAEQIASKTGDSDAIPTIAEEGAYQVWADGLAERAQSVHEPDLARDATALASLSGEFVDKFSDLRAQTRARAPGAPAPPVVYQMAALNTQITDTVTKLSDACPT